MQKWKFAVDRGGTFTDVVGVDPDGFFHTLKLLSNSSLYEDAAIEGIRRMLGLERGETLPENEIAGIRIGTTVATNALLERKGGKVALIITKGFSDLLEIGYQDRPDLFALCIRKPARLYTMVVEADERIDCHGAAVRSLDEEHFASVAGEIRKAGVDSVAVVLMHAWINPAHEQLCEEILKEQGFTSIFLSHRSVNLIKIVSRGQSTLMDAYLSTVLSLYLNEIQNETGNIPLDFMQSDGMLSSPETFTGRNAILSGPAGGAVAVSAVATESGLEGAIGFDMGGTSTDVCRFSGEFEKVFERTLAGIPLQGEMLNIITVAAGGGSILIFDGQKMAAGPESAGSDPGPACYGFGGPLTVTDANLLTGRLTAGFFPETFGPDRNSPLDDGIVREKFLLLSREINSSAGTEFSPADVANGFLRVANERMAQAIREISVSKGFDARRYTLVCFGGAGGQHACAIASLLGMSKIVVHPLGSVMSAYGIGLSGRAWKSSRTLCRVYDTAAHNDVAGIFREMELELLKGTGKPQAEHDIVRQTDLRPLGTETSLTVSYGEYKDIISDFRTDYARLFGFDSGEPPLEIVNLRLEVRETEKFFPPLSIKYSGAHEVAPVSFQEVYYSDGPKKAPVYRADSLPPHHPVSGPSIIVEPNSTVVIDPGFEAEKDESGVIIIRKVSQEPGISATRAVTPDPVLIEVFHNLFMGIATEMGLILRNTAHSVNMKERLDFSCAVFDGAGDLVANAPHIPVHLGSMSDTVRAVIEDNGNSMRHGDVYLTNNPYRGGSHLPDMTVVCPVFSEKGEIMFFTAARGHHSDIGGATPGSMPPNASHIDEEGVLVDNFLLIRDGVFREGELRDLLSGHAYPVRNIDDRVNDLRAQVASCRKGVEELRRVIKQYGWQMVKEYMGHIQDNAEYMVKRALLGFVGRKNTFEAVFEDRMDDGFPIRVRVTIEGGDDPPDTLRAVIDFTGTGGLHETGNLNAPFSVTRSAVLYVLRALMNTDIPLNSGCLRPVEIIVPPGTILNPAYPAPVASGNVETSQRVVDVLLGAFGVAAASQGTMNNLLFEVEGETPYYETIAGGAGAVENCPGASGVQVHMTNTRMTDPEVLEFRHPGIRLDQFSLRKGSGGSGKFPGGEGVIREIRFLKPGTVSILSERRLFAPYGIEGGGPGEKGENLLKRGDGKIDELGHRQVLNVNAGESIIIKTPGGGGYGKG
jgi:5-oxoprolinase (ATP-hydrolysing)